MCSSNKRKLSIIVQLIILTPWRVASDWVVTRGRGMDGMGREYCSVSLSLSTKAHIPRMESEAAAYRAPSQQFAWGIKGKARRPSIVKCIYIFSQVFFKRINWLQRTTVIQNSHHLSTDEILIFFHGSTKATEKNVSWFPFKLLLTESRFKSKSECTSQLLLSLCLHTTPYGSYEK